ncbi:MAG TPA: site-specific integrase, partial [Burkholderiales bacterium]|nr:site-specific integrase [Burkholderiales bacterium]
MRSRSHGAAVAREYLQALEQQRRLSPATLRNYGRALGLLLKQTDSLETLEPADVRRFIAMLHAKGASPRTLALTLSAWRGYFRWLVRHRGLRANPVLGIRAPRAARPLPKALSVEAA